MFKKVGKVLWDCNCCKYCNLCVEFCPKKVLSFENNDLKQHDGCIKCKLCEQYCPDLAIKVGQGEK